MEKLKLTITSGNYVHEPIVLEGITWETSRKEEPSKLKFTVIKDNLISFAEGNEVNLYYGDKHVFKGYVFEKSRNKDHHIEVLAYDQLRYLQNKTTYRCYGLRADQIIDRIAKDFKLEIGEIANTKFVIPVFDKSDSSLFDMIQDAIDETVYHTDNLYYLYDDCGKLTLKNIADSLLPVIIDKDTAEDFNYKSSIDSETYNRIVIAEDSEKSGKGVYKVAMDEGNASKWGVLQYFESGYKGVNALEKAKTLLKKHNQVTRSLTLNDCFGDISVRGGTSLYVDLDLGDQIAKQKMLVEKATHTFKNDKHSMTLSVIGCKEFYGE